MNRKTILFIVIICVVIVGVIYLIILQFSGRWIYVHEFEADISDYQFHNLTEEDMERFPFLLESIQTNSDVHISEEEYNELLDFLNNSMYIEWENKYYNILT